MPPCPSRLLPLLLGVLVLSLSVRAQPPVRPPVRPAPDVPKPPVFTPPDPGEQEPPPALAPAAEPVPSEPDRVDQLFARLARWPRREAREAAAILSGLGEEVPGRLVAGLQDNDWRVRAGCALALAQRGDRAVVPDLVKAIELPAQRAGRAEIMRALTRLDPQRAPDVILPYVSHASARVRKEAFSALPTTLEERQLQPVLALANSKRGAVRAMGFDLLGRIPGQEVREEFFLAFFDPDPQVSRTAAWHLATREEPEVRARLLRMAETAPDRAASFAFLALVRGEDLGGQDLIPDQGAIVDRLQRHLGREDHFLRGCAAVALANVAYRSRDAKVRRVADRYLIPILWGVVAGRIYFREYTLLAPLCYRKMELLSGMSFGSRADRWQEWWRREGERFRARRRLREILPADAEVLEIGLRWRRDDGSLRRVQLSGSDEAWEQGALGALVLAEEERQQLVTLLRQADFLATTGTAVGDERAPFADFVVSVGRDDFRRTHPGAMPAALLPLAEWMLRQDEALGYQRFVPGRAAAERQAAAAKARRELAAATDDAGRERVWVETVLAGYPGLPEPVRTTALEVLERASPEARLGVRDRLAPLLRAELGREARAARLGALAAGSRDPQVRAALADLARTLTEEQGVEVLAESLAGLPPGDVIPLLSTGEPLVRAAAARRIGSFRDVEPPVRLLVGGLSDREGVVREACLEALVSLRAPRVVALLETLMRGEDERLAVRAIPALGSVGGEAVVPKLSGLWTQGSPARRWAALEGLRRAGGRSGAMALGDAALGPGSVSERREALRQLGMLEAEVAGPALERYLQRTTDAVQGAYALELYAARLGERARPLLRRELENPSRARSARLLLARAGDATVVPGLLRDLERLEGDPAAEAALEELCFHEEKGPSPAARASSSIASTTFMSARTLRSL
jgi:HEAT repeat protein